MFRKVISYLVIFSLLSMDIAFAMKRPSGDLDRDEGINRSLLIPIVFEKQDKSNLDQLKDSNKSDEILQNLAFSLPKEKTSSTDIKTSKKERNNHFEGQQRELTERSPLLQLKESENNNTDTRDIDDENLFKQKSIQDDNQPLISPLNSRNGSKNLNKFKRAERIERIIGYFMNEKDSNLEQAARRLMRAENRPFVFKWHSLDHFVEKAVYAIILRKSHVSGVDASGYCNPDGYPLWMEGRGIPLKSGLNYARSITGFREGTEFICKQSLFFTLQGLLGYQLYEQIHTHLFKPGQFSKIIIEGDNASIQLALSVIVKNPTHAPYFLSFFAAPVLWGLIKAGIFARTTFNDTPDNFNKVVKDINRFSRSITRAGKKGVWQDNVRWLLPLHPVSRKMNYLVYHLLFDGKLELFQRDQALKAIINLTRYTTGWSKVTGLDALQKLSAGTYFSQFDLVEKSFGRSYQEALAREKVKAFDELYKQNLGIHQASFTGLPYNLYAHYLRWTLGDFDNIPSALTWAIFKATTVALTANLFVSIARQIIDYLKCPSPLQQGFSYTLKTADYYSSYNTNCLNAYFNNFNKVLGQNASALVNILPNFINIDSSQFTTLNFSGQGITGQQIGAILQGLYQYLPQIKITTLDLSNNNIGSTAEDTEAFIASLPLNLICLNLSENNFGSYEGNGMTTFANAFSSLVNLRILDLSENIIGYKVDNEIISIGNNLSYLTNLQILNLSGNFIDYTADDGTIAIGNNLSYLTNLQILNFSANAIGATADNGTIAIANALPYLKKLEILNFSRNSLGGVGDIGVIAIANALSSLKNLKDLNLSENNIGHTGENGFVSICNILSYLTNLQNLDLSSQAYINCQNDNITIAITEALMFLKALKNLSLSINNISCGEPNNTVALISGIIQLQNLTSLYISQSQLSAIPLLEWQVLRNFWNNRNINTDIYTFISTNDIDNFLGNLSIDIASISLANKIQWLDNSQILLLLQNISHLPHLQTLDLSNTNLNTSIFGDVLSTFNSLTSLNFSNNAMQSETEWEFIRNLSTNMKQLNFFNIQINYDGVYEILGQDLKHLTNLESLVIADTFIGNKIGMKSIGESLHFFSNLTILDFSSNYIGETSKADFDALIVGLNSTKQLRTLNLSNNQMNRQQIENLMSIVPNLVCNGLEIFDISGNYFPNTSWDQINNNLEKIYSLQIQQACEANQCFGTPINFSYTVNCSFSNQITGSTAFSLTPPLIFRLPKLAWKEISSQLYQLYYPNQLSQNIFPQQIDSFIDNDSVIYQIKQNSTVQNFSEPYWLAVYKERESVQSFSTGLSNLFLSSTIKGAGYTFLLEIMKDGFTHIGISKHITYYATTALQLSVLFSTVPSIVPTLTSMAVNGGLSYMGVPSQISSIASTSAAIISSFINGDSTTPTHIIVSICGSLIGSNFAIKAKNKLFSWLSKEAK